jgi:uncharacterized membrane protein YhhN
VNNKIIPFLFFLTGILFLLFENSPSFVPAFILKMLMIPLLVILFLLNLKPAGNRLHMLILAGLLFCWAGDILLEVPGQYADLFVPGLGCFLLGHVMYLLVFFLTPGENFLFRKGSFFLVPVVLYGALLVWWLYNGLGNMRIPVIAYAVVILTMLAGAINRKEKVNSISYFLVLTGAILFVISDSAIAINKFGHHFTGSSIVVMTTYLAAQYLIVTGYLRQGNIKNN